MGDMDMPATARLLLLRFLMWFIMMMAMMTPSNLPAVLLFQRVAERSSAPVARTLLFASGYVTAWGLFSILATALQTELLRVNLVSAAGPFGAAALSAGLLAAVGVYQWVPLKNSCLSHCRSPVDFLTRRFRPSVGGSWLTGLEHGLYCIGCCWLLMMLLFIGGVMNLLWIAGITVLVAVEKLLTRGVIPQRLIGSGLIAAAAVVFLVRAA